jgi:hypothetical protein
MNNRLMVLLLLLISATALSQVYISVTPGFVTGDTFRSLDPDDKAMYAMGLVDGYYAAPLLANGQADVDWLSACLTGIRPDQIVAILDNYLEDNPLIWSAGMNGSASVALQGACKK